MKKILLSFALALSVVTTVATPVFAGPLGKGLQNLKEANKNTGLEDNLQESVGTVIKAVLAMVGTIFLGLTIYAGILWMTASGNDEQVSKAVGIIKAAIIGLFITMSAYAITYFITSKVGGGEDTGTPTGSVCSSVSPTVAVCQGKAVGSSCSTGNEVCTEQTSTGAISGQTSTYCTCE